MQLLRQVRFFLFRRQNSMCGGKDAAYLNPSTDWIGGFFSFPGEGVAKPGLRV